MIFIVYCSCVSGTVLNIIAILTHLIFSTNIWIANRIDYPLSEILGITEFRVWEYLNIHNEVFGGWNPSLHTRSIYVLCTHTQQKPQTSLMCLHFICNPPSKAKCRTSHSWHHFNIQKASDIQVKGVQPVSVHTFTHEKTRVQDKN